MLLYGLGWSAGTGPGLNHGLIVLKFGRLGPFFKGFLERSHHFYLLDSVSARVCGVSETIFARADLGKDLFRGAIGQSYGLCYSGHVTPQERVSRQFFGQRYGHRRFARVAQGLHLFSAGLKVGVVGLDT